MFKKRAYKANTPFIKKGYKGKSSNTWGKKSTTSKSYKSTWSKTRKPSTFKWKPKNRIQYRQKKINT